VKTRDGAPIPREVRLPGGWRFYEASLSLVTTARERGQHIVPRQTVIRVCDVRMVWFRLNGAPW
jgi:hypothetical protein